MAGTPPNSRRTPAGTTIGGVIWALQGIPVPSNRLDWMARAASTKHPERVIEYAVKGMLPKGPLGRQMYTKLFVYAGPDHKHAAQKPEVLTF